MGEMVMLSMMLLYALFAGGVLLTVAIAPFYLLFALGRRAHAAICDRRGRRPASRELARAHAELREQYASGVLTLVGLEERTEAVQRASSHFELASVIDDLPRRTPPPTRSARFEALAGIALVLFLHSLWADAIGALLVAGALAPAPRWRVTAGAFAAGVAVLAAPLAAVALAVSAGLRWQEGREGAGERL